MAFETRLTSAMSQRWRGAGLWSDETFADVLARRARETPDKEAVTDGTRRLSYRELAHGIEDHDHSLKTAAVRCSLSAGDLTADPCLRT